jgi:hypothetical protein
MQFPLILKHLNKAISVIDHGGLYGCEMLRISRQLTHRWCGKAVSLMHWPKSTPQKLFVFLASGTHLC